MWKHWFDSGFVFEPRKEKEKFERSEWKKLWQTKITNSFYPHHFCDFCFFLRRLHTHLLLVPRRRLATTIHLKHQALRQTPSQKDLDYHQVKLLYQVKSRINWYVILEVLSSSRKLKQRRFWADTSTGSTAFSHFDMPCPTMQNVHFRLASVAQKRLSLSSLVSKT